MKRQQALSVHTRKKEKTEKIWDIEEILALFDLPFNELAFQAAGIHREHFDPNAIQVSTLLSIKTGGCPEDCKYCPQSAHYNTEVDKEELMDVEATFAAAKQAKQAGASRFCMGAAWRKIHNRDMPTLQAIVAEVKTLGLETCMTLGMAELEQLEQLKQAGLDYYNHNIDTAEDYYKNIITSRSFEDRLNTLENIHQAGLKTCCGGIVGLGENRKQRCEMLQVLANLQPSPESVPINKLVKVPGTPLEQVEDISSFEFIRTVAVARIIMPYSMLRLSAGREDMSKEMQSLCFLVGANSIFYGEKLLTTANPDREQDKQLFSELGLKTV